MVQFSALKRALGCLERALEEDNALCGRQPTPEAVPYRPACHSAVVPRHQQGLLQLHLVQGRRRERQRASLS